VIRKCISDFGREGVERRGGGKESTNKIKMGLGDVLGVSERASKCACVRAKERESARKRTWNGCGCI